MRKEWFEEVDGKPSRFSDLCTYALRQDHGMGNAADYAFRTLLAEDAAVGDSAETAYESTKSLSLSLGVAFKRIATLERKVKRLRRNDKGTGLDIISMDERLTPLEEFLDGVPAFGAAFEGLKQVAPAPTPRPFRVGDRVITRRFANALNGAGCFSKGMEEFDDVEGTVQVGVPPYPFYAARVHGYWWPASALELVTAVDAPSYDAEGEYTDKAKESIKIIEHPLLESALTASQAEVRRLEGERESDKRIAQDIGMQFRELQAERDSLQAQLDAKFIRSDEPFTKEQLRVSREIASHAYMADCVLVHRPLLDKLKDDSDKLDEMQRKPDDSWAAQLHRDLGCFRQIWVELCNTLTDISGRNTQGVPKWNECHGKAPSDYAIEYVKALAADLAAYRARVEAGKVVESVNESVWSQAKFSFNTHTALLIDEAPIAPAGEPMFTRYIGNVPGFYTPDTRKGERRQGKDDRRNRPAIGEPFTTSTINQRGTWRKYPSLPVPSFDIDYARSNTRRAADRRQA